MRTHLALLLLALAACDRNAGERRPLEALWPSTAGPPVVRCRGEEVRHGGKWVKDGEVVFYDKDGVETHRGEYRLGVEHGPWTEIGESGAIGKGEYVDGKRHGPWVYTFSDGRRQEEGSYATGERNGRWTRWYSDGRVASEIQWKAGAQHGPATYWNRDGSVNTGLSGEYADGEKVR